VRRAGLILAACGVLAGVVGPAAPGRTQPRRMVIRLISNNSIVSSVDKAPKGKLSAGDRLTTRSTLRNQVAQFGKPRGALVGRDWATLTVVSPSSYETHGYAVLPGGRILFAGRLPISGSVPALPVTGGTGRFAHARGALLATDLGGSRALNVYRLTLP
jgi:hypothetical protein